MELVSEKVGGKHHRDARPALEHQHKHGRQACSTGATEIHDQRQNHAALTNLIMAFDQPVAYFLTTFDFPGVFRCSSNFFFFFFFLYWRIKAARGDLKSVWMQQRSYFPADGMTSPRNGWVLIANDHDHDHDDDQRQKFPTLE